MEPPSKRICVAADDRLSDLPDCLIHSILSFLESRQVVQSSLLSRRWRYLWPSVPCIDIDLTVFRRGDHYPGGECCKGNFGKRIVCKKDRRSFEEFGNHLLLLNNATSLDKLRIHVPTLDTDDKHGIIEACSRWTGRCVHSSPAVIDSHINSGCSWGSVSLTLPDLGPSSSSRLTRLLLHGVKLGGSFAEQLRSVYPVLQELSLVRCSCHFGEIMSRTLQHLTIDDCVGFSQFGGMVVTAPRLTSLRTHLSAIDCPNGMDAKDTSSLVTTLVRVSALHRMNASFRDKLCNIFNVTHLELFGDTMLGEIQRMADKLPKFHNVKTLLINRCCLLRIEHIQTLDHFLQSTPRLEKLTLQNCEFSYYKRRSARAKWRHVALQSQNVMSFKCDNLEVIEIKHRKDGNVHELFEILMGLWRNLGKASIKLTKV